MFEGASGLLKSRRFISVLVGLIVTILSMLDPALRELRSEIYTIIWGFVAVLVLGYTITDVAHAKADGSLGAEALDIFDLLETLLGLPTSTVVTPLPSDNVITAQMLKQKGMPKYPPGTLGYDLAMTILNAPAVTPTPAPPLHPNDPGFYEQK